MSPLYLDSFDRLYAFEVNTTDLGKYDSVVSANWCPELSVKWVLIYSTCIFMNYDFSIKLLGMHILYCASAVIRAIQAILNSGLSTDLIHILNVYWVLYAQHLRSRTSIAFKTCRIVWGHENESVFVYTTKMGEGRIFRGEKTKYIEGDAQFMLILAGAVEKSCGHSRRF